MKRRAPPELPKPSAAAYRALGPYARARLTVRALGQTLALDVPCDVFSAQHVDEGTLLLLDHLPEGAPQSVFDLGCGYGALGLPVAARFPEARCELVDRDLLAVAASAHNAAALGLRNVTVRPGLGYRGVRAPFDWVLCNVPARIGPAAIRAFLEGGRAIARRDVRVVVIRDLAEVCAPLARHVARGPRHDVFALDGAATGAPDVAAGDDAIYARDETEFLGLRLSRPHDASEDPQHRRWLALLADALPRTPPAHALAFRCGYGALPLHLRARYPAAEVLAQDRDLLDLAFASRNAATLQLPITLRETLFFDEGLAPRSFALVTGELSASAGEGVARRELQDACDLLAPGGEALILASDKMVREWLPAAAPRGLPLTKLLFREGACVLRLARPRGET